MHMDLKNMHFLDCLEMQIRCQMLSIVSIYIMHFGFVPHTGTKQQKLYYVVNAFVMRASRKKNR